ncbi:MAG TPA: ABC-2 transporter permease [Planctomycetaceae bacterium]|nr:ABC-2 transporter permease [Planctomycetaceae bacterium]HQZ64046.1 ABC-2 transporter permease [Planctomycetaceae bacterium]
MNFALTIAQVTVDARKIDWTWTWLTVFGLFVGLVVLSYSTRTGVIARATTKEAIRQPLFILLLLVSAGVLILNSVMPFFTMESGDDVKMLNECGLATLLIAGALLAIWTAGTTITSDIEGKTAMTLLSKPIDRRQFILGKYIGIVQAVIWMFVILTAIFSVLIFFKVGYDQREHAEDVTPRWQWHEVSGVELPLPHPDRMRIIGQVMPGVVLAFLQVCVLGAIAVTAATRLPMVMNLVICFAVFVIGNLTEVMVNRSVVGEANESVTFTARLISMVIPSLSSFNVSSAVATGRVVPQDYLGYSLLYALAYIGAMMLLGFILFEDRDLA